MFWLEEKMFYLELGKYHKGVTLGDPQKGNWQTVQTQIRVYTLFALTTGISMEYSYNKN